MAFVGAGVRGAGASDSQPSGLVCGGGGPAALDRAGVAAHLGGALRRGEGGDGAGVAGVVYLHLPFAGILSTESVHRVDKKLKELHSMVKKMGCKLDAPFIQMSFLSLPVIPSLKITDKGLVDVNEFKIIPVLIPDITGDAFSFLPA